MERSDVNSKERTGAPTRVLLTGTNRWPAPARLAIGFAKAGCEVSAVCPSPGHPLLKTRAVQRAFPYSALRPLDSLTAAIEATDPRIIIPCDDLGVQHLHDLYVRTRSQGGSGDWIATLIERSLGSPESYPIVPNRYRLLQIAREEGLLVPHTNPIDTTGDFGSGYVGWPFPWVLKADGTWGGKGVRIANVREQAEQFFGELTRAPRATAVIKRLVMHRDRLRLWASWHRSKPAVIVQSYIQGRPANCAVACWEGKVLAGIGVEVVSAEGLQGPAIVVRVVDNSEMMVAAERIARRLRLSGFFGLDFMIEDETNATYLIEMNPRCTPLCHLRLGKGHDMIGSLRAQFAGESFGNTPPVTHNDMIAYFPQAWTSQSQFLELSFQDVPQEEPDLMDALLHPWSERSLVGRAVDSLRRLGRKDRATPGCVFPAAVMVSEVSETLEV